MSDSAFPLNPHARANALDAMSAGGHELDVVVIGGGVVGTGVTLDAVTRGLTVGLLEARDWAAGTSSRSSKLIHGGLRYLEQLDFALVREALRERSLILSRLSPHLARPVPFLYPLQHRVWERFYVGSGIALYDTLGGRHGVPSHRHLTRRQALKQFPSLKGDALVGAIRYYDGQVDDARHTMMLARTAAEYGAHVATSARVTGFIREGDRVAGVHVHDLETGRRLEVRARQTINAAGVWSDDIQEMAGGRGQINVRASKGVHIVVPRDRIRAETGLISRTDKSVLFLIPWENHWIIGTTDTAWDLDKSHPSASRSDVDYILHHANRLLAVPLTHDDVVGVYAGLRPLLSGESEFTSQLSREHAVVSPVAGLTMVAGGKYTTYRVMASDAVNAVIHGIPHTVPASITDRIPLVGAEGFAAAWNDREQIADDSGLHPSRIEHLLKRYGSLIREMLTLISEKRELGEPLNGAPSYLKVEAVYAATHEGALHLDDILTRRTRISVQTSDRGLVAADEVAALVAPVLGWNEEQLRNEVAHYRARVEAELDSQRQPDDHTADAARLGAPDVRAGGHRRTPRPATTAL